MSRFVRPETATLTLGNGDQLTIRKRLTAGEQRAAYARLYTTGADGRLKVDPMESGIALIEAYLLDWNLCDDDDVPVVIRPDKYRAPDLDTLRAALDSLDHASLIEIKEAIETHERATLAAREAEKKDPHWRERRLTDIRIARRCGWTLDDVRNLDPDDYQLVMDELIREQTPRDSEAD